MAEKTTRPNKTGTELDVLKSIEQSFFRSNPGAQKRNTAASNEWFRKNVTKNFSDVRTARLFRDRKLWRKNFEVGSLFTYEYDAINKDTLPVWDRYPMMFVFNIWRSKAGNQIVSGLNLHFLPPKLRLAAFRALITTRSRQRYDRSTKLKISWEVLQTLANHDLFQHCVRNYRVDHLVTVAVKIPPESWELALWLPTQRFVGDVSKAWQIK